MKSLTFTAPATPMTSSALPATGATLREVTAPSAGRADAARAVGPSGNDRGNDDRQDSLHLILALSESANISES